jgi:hypothetical protein
MRWNHVLGAGAVLAMCGGVAQAQLLDQSGADNGPVLPAVRGPAPAFEIDRLRHAFGNIVDTDPVKTEFEFRNTGEGTLVIQDVHSTCGCTVPDLQQLEYAPGESGTLEVLFKPQGKQGMNHQRVTIRTNDPENPTTVLTISAQVVRQVYADPPVANMGQVHKRGTQDQLVSVYGRSTGFEVTNLHIVGSEFFSADIIGTEEEEVDGETLRRTDIVVSLNPGAAPGHINASIAATTNDPKHDLVNIQLAARIQGDVELSPSRIAFGRIEAGGQTEFPVVVRNARGEPFRILGLEESSNLDTETEYSVEPLDPETLDAYRVTFVFHASDKPGAARGRLQLRTDVPQEELVELSFLGRIVGPGEQTDASLPPGERPSTVTITDGR